MSLRDWRTTAIAECDNCHTERLCDGQLPPKWHRLNISCGPVYALCSWDCLSKFAATKAADGSAEAVQ